MDVLRLLVVEQTPEEQGLANALGAGPRIEVVGHASETSDIVHKLQTLKPDAVVFDPARIRPSDWAGARAAAGYGRGGAPPAIEASTCRLTRMEREVLKLLAEGKRNRSIAVDLFISINTVKTHIQSIFRKLRIQNRSQAVRYAICKGLVDAGEEWVAADKRTAIPP